MFNKNLSEFGTKIKLGNKVQFGNKFLMFLRSRFTFEFDW